MSVDKRVGQPLGHVAGDAAKPDGHPEAPRMALSPVGAMVERELLQSICLLQADGKVACHTYGNRSLLTDRRCLPVVCHRKGASRLSEQKARCLDEAAKGAVLVSPRIAKGEQEIMNEAMAHGFAVILIADNGFADRYHPSADHMDLCAESRLLIVTPWQYQYRPKDESISVTICKTMNCVAQALCRTKDSW